LISESGAFVYDCFSTFIGMYCYWYSVTIWNGDSHPDTAVTYNISPHYIMTWEMRKKEAEYRKRLRTRNNNPNRIFSLPKTLPISPK